jgi:hypothetical protein
MNQILKIMWLLKKKPKKKVSDEVDTEYSDFDLFNDQDVAKAQVEFHSNGISASVSSNLAKSTETSSSIPLSPSTSDSSPSTQSPISDSPSPVVEPTYEVTSFKSANIVKF